MSQSEPNLTVVIPVHNAAPHLGACVESLLAQSYTDFELILVENGSSDDSRERCARYAAEHPGRIRTLTLDEASVSAARNAGIDNARGRFITFMDADDWAEKEFLAEFFRDPAPGPGTIVMQGILLDFSEAEPPGPNEAFFSYDDGALAIGDDPSASRTRPISSPCGKTWSATRCYGPQTTSVSATAGASSEPLPPARSCSAQRPTRPAGIRC